MAVYYCELIKQVGGREWRNRHLFAGGTIDVPGAATLVNLCTRTEEYLYTSNVRIIRGEVYESSDMNNPDWSLLYSTNPNKVGRRSGGAAALPLEMTLVVTRETTMGRNGWIGYRGVFNEGDCVFDTSTGLYKPIYLLSFQYRVRDAYTRGISNYFAPSVYPITHCVSRPPFSSASYITNAVWSKITYSRLRG